jgi:polysaccharide export outer membrane protein
MPILRSLSAAFRIFSAIAIAYSLQIAFAQEAASNVTASTEVAVGSADYQLRPTDVLQVKVFQEEDLTREVSVSKEFTISLPLIGNVDVRNRSVRQVEELIRDLYNRDFLVNPQVTLIVLRYAERSVNVIGMVNSPQAVPFPNERGLTLLEAIARAGGFNRLADRSKVSITRTDDNGNTTTFTVDAVRMIGGRSDTQIPLQVNDVINVPEKFL